MTFNRFTDDIVRRNAPPKPTRGFLGYQVAGGPYLLIDATDPKVVYGRTDDGSFVRAVNAGVVPEKDAPVVFKRVSGTIYAYPDTRKAADSGQAAAEAIAGQSEPIAGWRLQPGIVGFVEGTLTVTPAPVIYINWRGELQQSLASPLDITGAVTGLGSGEYAWVIVGVDERTNDSAYHVSTATEDAPDILQALAVQVPLFQYQYAVLVHDGQTVLTFSFDTWQDLRPWGSTPTRRRDNLDATTDPGASDDISEGYDVLSEWLNVSDGGVFKCVDATEGAAVWQEVTFV